MSKRAEDTVVIRNIYYMMAYAFRALSLIEYRKLALESFEHLDDLLAAILVIGISSQRRRGFEREYQEQGDALAGIRGRIDMGATARLKMAGRVQAHCFFDEFTEDTYKNRILKRCAEVLLRSAQVSRTRKEDLKRSLLFLRDVSSIDENRIAWDRLTYHRNNATYRLLMNVCYMVLHDKLLTNEDGTVALADFDNAQRLSALYEAFILEYYRVHHPELNPSAKIIKNGISEKHPAFLPQLCTDITLESNDKTLIIDAKCYGQILGQHFDREILSPTNRNQILSYVIHEAYGNEKQVEGMLLYALTEHDRALHETWQEVGHTFHCFTLDLGHDFEAIAQQLEDIVGMVA